MKYLVILTVGVCLLIATVPAVADQAEDAAAIMKMLVQSDVFINKKDAKALAGLMDEVNEDWDGSNKGRAAQEKASAEFMKNQKAYQYKALDEIGLIFVTPDVAIFKEYGEWSGYVDENGKTLPPGKGLYAGVVVKRNGKWLIAAEFTRPITEE